VFAACDGRAVKGLLTEPVAGALDHNH